MGIFFSSSCSSKSKDVILSNYDMTIYNQKKTKIFWGTIAICLIYTLIAFIMFMGSYMSNKFKFVLLNRYFTFTVVFIIGTIIIVSYLYYQVYYFKAIKINRANVYDTLSCPDYWKLERVNITDNNSNAFDSNISRQLFNYRCVMDPKIFNKGDIAKTVYIPTGNNNGSANYQLRITDSGLSDDLIQKNTNINYDTYKNSLYAGSDNVMNSSNFFKYQLNNKYSAGLLLHHNMIMNNYSLNADKSGISTTDKNVGYLSYTYNIPSAETTKYENDLNIYNLKYKIANSSDISSTTSSKNVAIKFTRDEKNKMGINFGLSSVNPTVAQTNANSEPKTRFPIVCDKLYPLYLATADKELNKLDANYDENLNRCAFAKACNIPWSDLNCEKYDL